MATLSQVHQPRRIALGLGEFMYPSSHTQRCMPLSLAVCRQHISRCKIYEFRRFMGQVLQKGGWKLRQGSLSEALAELGPVAAKLRFCGVRSEGLEIFDPDNPRRFPDRLFIQLEFIQPRPGLPRSGHYFGTLPAFQQYAIFL